MDPNDLTPEHGTEQPQEEAITPQEPPIDPAPAEEQAPLDPENDPNSVEFWKKKATAQGQENIVLSRKLEDATRPKELTNQPTDSDLRAAFPEWEVMTENERSLARRTFATERLTTSILQEREQEKATQRWNTELELTIAQKPALQGKEQAFKEFANKPTHRGAPLETLVSAFLFEASSTPTPTRPTPRTPGLESGTGGPKTPEKPKLLSGEELKNLRQSDPAAHRKYILEHDVSQLEL
jgi:hypothetical protein